MPQSTWAAVVVIAAGVVVAACGTSRPDAGRDALDAAAQSYVRLALALGDRDSDSLDSYHGPPAWQVEAHATHATLAQIRASAAALAGALASPLPRPATARVAGEDDAVRRAFLIRQLNAITARVDVLQGARYTFADEMRLLFQMEPPDASAIDGRSDEGASDRSLDRVRGQLDRLLPGRGELSRRYAAFDRQFIVPPDRIGAVLSRAIDGCRTATRAHVALPAGERVNIVYVRDSPWSAFTRYEGHFVSRVTVNTGFALTVDRTLDLACHETYPGHHAIASWLETREGGRRPELLVQLLFSPQTGLHEAAASLAPALAFPDEARLAFERDQLFPLAGLNPDGAPRYVAVARLVDEFHRVEADIVRRYVDGALDFPRAAAALERQALVPSADAMLKFVNQFRSYAATYTIGRDRLSHVVDGDWTSYVRAVTDPAQTLPLPNRR